MSREHPIIFSTPMVKAILAGRKTQTRRVVTDHNSQGNYCAAELLLDDDRVFVDPGPSPAGNPGPYLHAPVRRDPDVVERLYPRIFPGNRLWVRETFYCDDVRYPEHNRDVLLDCMYYRADGECCDQIPECQCADVGPTPWRPSIHMPRWAARLFLRVESVRVERLQEITERDAKAEGVRAISQTDVRRQATYTDRQDFAQLWNAINGKRHPWELNPWVWVVEFTRVREFPDV